MAQHADTPLGSMDAFPAPGDGRPLSMAWTRALEGAGMSVGAPLGWLLIRKLQGVATGRELAEHASLYLYMLLGTLGAFGVFGFLLGRSADRLAELTTRLSTMALTDSLTGLRNARYFHARLNEEYAESQRTGVPLALALLDLDHFKRINDQHGHPAGDVVLATVANAIASVTRKGETEARVGGEEFAVLLQESTGSAGAEAADRVRAAIAAAESRHPGSPKIIRVTASAGVASTSDLDVQGPEDLYRAADRALYRAKREGRNRTVVAEGSSVPIRSREGS